MKIQVITNRTDNVNRLFTDINSIKRFDREEEDRLIKKYKETGCLIARNKVIENNLLFAVTRAKLATRHNNNTMTMTDLLSVCTEGMIHAIERFDPSQGNKFISYAVMWIRQRITTYIQAKSTTIKSHCHVSSIFSCIDRLQHEGKDITPDNILDNLHEHTATSYKKKFSIEVVKDILNTMHVGSLDLPIGYDAENREKTHLDTLKSFDFMPDESFATSDIKDLLFENIERLNERERKIIVMFFGLDGDLPLTLEGIGYEIGITRERVRQIKNKALTKLRVYIKKGGSYQKKLF